MSFISITDIDECTRDTDFCDTNAECSDTIGSYECFCRTGYSGDGFNCTSTFMSCPLCRCSVIKIPMITTDIDECKQDMNNCHTEANCTDTEGSFYCTCNNGFEGDDGTHCESMCTP